MPSDVEEEGRNCISSIKPLVFGGIDGLTTTLALIWSSIAAGENVLSSNAVMVVGVANLLATATSMGIGDYVGTVAEHEASRDAKCIKTSKSVRVAAFRSGITMFLSFVVFGGLPLAALLPFFGDLWTRRLAATLLCIISFFALGAAKSRMSGDLTLTGSLRSSGNMAAMGSAAAFVSFTSSKLIAWLLLNSSEIPA